MKKTILSFTIMLLLTACGDGGSSNTTITPNLFNTQEKLGENLFFDKNLSLSQNTSCATCHDPDHAFIDARFLGTDINQSIFVHGALSVGDDGKSLGGRNSPTISYAMFSPEFNSTTITGGQFYDGRAATLKEQALMPPLDGTEMQMTDKESVMNRIQENDDYVIAFKTLFGEDIFTNVDKAYAAMGEAISKFEKTDIFSPFDSKYDRYVICKENGGTTGNCLNEGNWTNDEQLGMDLFFSQEKTNCASCHQLKASAEVTGETFTNYKYENIGTPKNLTALQARANLGLGDISDIDHGALTQGSADGALKVPTLRNIAITGPYMHNGIFTDLTSVLKFYERRRVGGETQRPPNVKSTINHELLQQGQELTDSKMAALEAFLKTLTDSKYEHLIK